MYPNNSMPYQNFNNMNYNQEYNMNNNQEYNMNYNQGYNNNNNNNYNNYNNQINNDLLNYQIDMNIKEKENIYKDLDLKIKELFKDEKLKMLSDEIEILNFFAKKEKECLDYIEKSFNGLQAFKVHAFEKIKTIFYHNEIIRDKTEIIFDDISSIPIYDENIIKSEGDYYKQLQELFKDAQIPQCLIENELKKLKIVINNLYNTKGKGTNLYKAKRNVSLKEEGERVIELYEEFKEKKNFLLGIINKEDLFYLFVAINYKVFLKPYLNDKFIIFLQKNIDLIKTQFSDRIDYLELRDTYIEMEEKKANEKAQYFFHKLWKEIIDNPDKILNILASLYCLLFYEFKISGQEEKKSNIGNVYINLILKNFVFFLDNLDESFKNKLKFKKSFFQLLNELYSADIKYLIEIKFYPEENKNYSFKDIDSILMNDDFVNERYKELKKQFSKIHNENDGVFNLLKKNVTNMLWSTTELTKYEKKIKLEYAELNVFSNTITILIDGFTTEDKDQFSQWGGLLNYFKNKETIFYFFKWPSSSITKIINSNYYIPISILNNSSVDFAKATKRAEFSGKILAYILLSSEFFNNFQINLIGFSLGAHVIKNCLEELNIFNNITNKSIQLKNVILIAGATEIPDKNLWKNFIEKLIIERFINCFSEDDNVLNVLYKRCMFKCAIGGSKLEINNNENNNLVLNYDFTQNKFGHLDYKYDIVAKKIFAKNKDI